MKPNLYTIECPKCIVLEKKLKSNNIDFNKVTDFDKDFFISKGVDKMPILEIEPGNYLEYKEAVEWVNNFTNK